MSTNIGKSFGVTEQPSAVTNAAALDRNINRTLSSTDPYYLDTFGRTTFPASYTAIRPEEAKRLQTTQSVIHQSNAAIQYNIGEKEVDIALRIEDAVRKYTYDKAFMTIIQQFGHDPASLDKFKSLYPEFFKLRLQYITQVAKLQARIAALKLNGIQTSEDLDFYLSFQVLDSPAKARIITLINTPIHKLEEIHPAEEGPKFAGMAYGVPTLLTADVQIHHNHGGLLSIQQTGGDVASRYIFDPSLMGTATGASGFAVPGFRRGDRVPNNTGIASLFPHFAGTDNALKIQSGNYGNGYLGGARLPGREAERED